MRFYIHTFGCQMNENDSKLLAEHLLSAGHTPAADIDDAQLIVVNTCCVREAAENRALGFIGSIKKHKQQRPETIIAVCGCMAQRSEIAEKLAARYRHVGVIIGTFAAARLPRYIAEYAATGRVIIDVEERYTGEELSHDTNVIDSYAGQFRAQVNINYGCNNFCSYCIVPYVRGRERSRQPQHIIDEIRTLAAAGVVEVQLLGQNVNSYGNDFTDDSWDFAALLTAVNDIDGLRRIRYMTSHPRDFDRRLAETIAGLDKVCHHFHLPLQSGSDRLLKLMNRGYSCDYYHKLLCMIRELFTDATITTDLIVGFPGESDEDHAQTLDFVAECQFDAAYTFLYSKRSGTPAAAMSGHISAELKKKRMQQLTAVQEPISLRKNQQHLGRVETVLVEGASKNDPQMLSGRNDGNKTVIFAAADARAGELRQLRITGAKTWNLYGELTKS
ncbi:MAG: tRNA (N6-isopentenyl adenosine(37)-C2)-methylthiotransferase MiaB [Bacillota bacterium]|nr:tRNA (N6-isopentenyl adenosine(37)-C2)-methylthiotransferase MiaB [Bacillota bacterium]